MLSLGTLGARTLEHLRYPAPLVGLANRSPFPFELTTGDGCSVGPGCRLRGDVTLGDRVRVGPNNVLDGRGHRYESVAGNVTLGTEVQLAPANNLAGDVQIGRYTNLNGDATITGDVSVGNFCAVGPELVVLERDHRMDKPAIQGRFYRRLLDSELGHVSDGPVELGHDVWTGRRATILSGVEVATGAVIGAGSVVTDDVAPYGIVAGTPAEHVGWRFSEQIRTELLDLAWWEWSEDRLAENAAFFGSSLDGRDSIRDLVA